MAQKVAVVTGANKGIGLAIVRGLCKRFEGVVYLTSRNKERGQKAVEELEKEGLHPAYHQLDISERKSIETFRDYIKEKYGGFDILVNNAAIAFKHNAPESPEKQAEETMRVNYFDCLMTCDILFPILRDGGRVINLSSSLGHLSMIPSDSLKQKLQDPNLTVPQLSELVQQYVDAVKQGTHANEWGNNSYAASKVVFTALTLIQQRMLKERNIKVNAVHPGFVDTDMTSHKGPMTVEEGAVAPLYLALDADDSVQGAFVWYDKRIVNWGGERIKEPWF